MKKVVNIYLLVAIFCLASSYAYGQTEEYEIIDLGFVGWGWDINNNSQVVGYVHPGETHAALYENGILTDLGLPPGATTSYAWDINLNGQIAADAIIGNQYHAFLYENNTWTALGVLPGMIRSNSSAINDSGKIVGVSQDSGTTEHSFIYENGVMTDLLGVDGHAEDINNNGQIVGQNFLYENGSWMNIPITAYCINDVGQIAGTSDGHAALYDNGIITDLGTLGGLNSMAYDINIYGKIVGTSKIGISTYNEHAFLYDNGTMIDLGTLGGASSKAFGINDSGQIVGYSINTDDEMHAVVWNPVGTPFQSPQGNPVPEPATILLFGPALLGLVGFRRKK